MTSLRALVIGAGPAALAMHLPVLSRLSNGGRLVLSMLCDLDTERARSAAGLFGFRDHGGDAHAALARPDIDVVYVFGSAQMHHGYGLAALAGGKHLFLEKPIAPSHAQAVELVQAAHGAGRVAVGGHNRRFYRAITRARAHAGQGGWGCGEAVFHKPEFGKPPPYGARSWLSANGIHALDALLYVMGGTPDQLCATSSTLRAGAGQNFAALLRWNDGRHASFLCNNEAGVRSESYRFHGAGVTFSIEEQGAVLATARGEQRLALPLSGDGIDAEHERFLEAVQLGALPEHALSELAPALFVAELIEQGHSGAVGLPRAEGARSGPPRARLRGQTVLVSAPAGLMPALARHLPDYRLVSPAEVAQSGAPRPDVVGAILGRSAEPLTESLLDQLPRLALVGIVGLSVARFAPERLLARDIAIVNAAAAYADSVAEFVLALAILGRRRAFASHELMRRGGWGSSLAQGSVPQRLLRGAAGLRPAARALHLEARLLRAWHRHRPAWASTAAAGPAAGTLSGSHAGLVGWGTSARRAAQLLQQLGARVSVWSEHASDTELRDAGVTRGSLAQVLAADIVSLHRGLTRATHHFLGAAELERLRPGCTLINVARGGLIQPDALLARLRRADVLACLDSFDEEPLPAAHALRCLPNVFLTSHLAGGSADMHAAAAEEVACKVRDFLAGAPPEPLSAVRLRTMS